MAQKVADKADKVLSKTARQLFKRAKEIKGERVNHRSTNKNSFEFELRLTRKHTEVLCRESMKDMQQSMIAKQVSGLFSKKLGVTVSVEISLYLCCTEGTPYSTGHRRSARKPYVYCAITFPHAKS